MTKLVTILGLSLLIVLHELGHYWVARLFGMRVHKFSIGFGPTLLSRRFGETVWQFAAVPLGGYVQIQGMGGEENEPSDGRGFKDKPRWQRALVLLAGPVFNWIVAVVLLVALASSVGVRDTSNPTTQLDVIEKSSAADRAGLRPGDRILSVDGVTLSGWDSLASAIKAHRGQPMSLEVEREGGRLALTATPDPSTGLLGIQPASAMLHYGPLEGVAAGIRQALERTPAQARMIFGVLTWQREGKLSGLPGIVKVLSAQADRSFAAFFDLLANLSIVLFIFNVAPFPALDGGRLVFIGIEAIRRRPVSETVEGWIHGVGLALILGLILFVSVRDLL